MDGKDIESTLNLAVARVGSGVPEWANQIIRVVCFPVDLLMLGLEKLTGEEKWQREQYRRMVEERPPLSSDEFLSHFEPEIDHRLVLAVRHAFSQSTGLPVESIYPSDQITDVGRLQWMGLDVLDIVFRTEIIADMRIPGVASAFGEQQPVTIQQLTMLMHGEATMRGK